MNLIFFDSEFIDSPNNDKVIHPLSIGLVNMDGRTYYAEPAETDRSLAGEWVQKNVLPLMGGPIKPSAQIRNEIVHFIGHKPQFWAYFGAYDWVVLCQFFGTMLDVPNHWPNYTNDLVQLANFLRIPVLEQTTVRHHALNDAVWTKDAFYDMLDRGNKKLFFR